MDPPPPCCPHLFQHCTKQALDKNLPVNNAFMVQMFQGQSDLCCIHGGHVFSKEPVHSQQTFYISPNKVFHHLDRPELKSFS